MLKALFEHWPRTHQPVEQEKPASPLKGRSPRIFSQYKFITEIVMCIRLSLCVNNLVSRLPHEGMFLQP